MCVKFLHSSKSIDDSDASSLITACLGPSNLEMFRLTLFFLDVQVTKFSVL